MKRAVLAFVLSACLISCRSQAPLTAPADPAPRQTPPSTVQAQPAPKDSAAPRVASTDPRDNRSTTGGLKGTSDDIDALPPGLPRFQLSADYPNSPELQTPPPPAPDMQALSSADPARAKAAARQWLTAMQAYLYADMNDQNPTDPNRNFRVGGGKTQISARRWYHMPWLHTPTEADRGAGRGRDGVWGLTRELDLKGPITAWPVNTGTQCVGTDWGIGFFNEPGGYAIGQVFPAGSEVKIDRAVFPRDTVSYKVLFTTATSAQVPAIEGAWEVDANVIPSGCRSTTPRQVTKVRHVQMDVMMRFGTGPDDWIFGAFIYNKNKRDQFWKGMEPVGVQFGPKLAQTVRVSEELTPNGLDGRLNGPADNPMSSCLSCHSRAQWSSTEKDSPRDVPFAPANKNDKQFICLLHEWGGQGTPGCPPCSAQGCIKPGSAPIIPGNQSLDYALQFGLALRNRDNALKP